MKRIQTYIDVVTTGLLDEYAKKSGCSVSHAAGKILAAYLMCDSEIHEYENKNKKRFLRVLNILNQVLLCVYDEKKVSVQSKNPKECLDKIKKLVADIDAEI